MGIELTTSRLRQHHQLTPVQHLHLIPLELCQKTQSQWHGPVGSTWPAWHKLMSRHNECDGVSNQQPHDWLLNRLFRRGSRKTSKLRVTGLCAGNSPVTGEYPAQRASNAENVSIWWRHYELPALVASVCSIDPLDLWAITALSYQKPGPSRIIQPCYQISVVTTASQHLGWGQLLANCGIEYCHITAR